MSTRLIQLGAGGSLLLAALLILANRFLLHLASNNEKQAVIFSFIQRISLAALPGYFSENIHRSQLRK